MKNRDVQITAESSEYDRVLGRIIDMNRQLNRQLKESKDLLESLNPLYKNVATSMRSYGDSSRGIQGSAPMAGFAGGGMGNMGGGVGGATAGSLNSIASIGGRLGSVFNQLNKVLSVTDNVMGVIRSTWFSFDEVIMPNIPTMPNFDGGRGRGGGGGGGLQPEGAPARSTARETSTATRSLTSALTNPAIWGPAGAVAGGVLVGEVLKGLSGRMSGVPNPFAEMEGQAQGAINALKEGVASLPNVKLVEPSYKTQLNVDMNVTGELPQTSTTTQTSPSNPVMDNMSAWVAMAVGLALTAVPWGRVVGGVTRGAKSMGSGLGRLGASTSRGGSAVSSAVARTSASAQGGNRIGSLYGATPSYGVYNKGGIHVSPHLGVVGDVKEATIPLDSPHARSAYQSLAENIARYMGGEQSGGGGATYEIHVAEGATVIADRYSVQRFANDIWDIIQQNLRNTGNFTFNRR